MHPTRANDWLWGRLDGATRLVDLLLDETRIREAGITEGALAAALDTDVTAARQGAVPDEGRLDFWRSVARDRLHRAILQEELPLVCNLFKMQPVDPTIVGFGQYIRVQNGAQRIDQKLKTTLEGHSTRPVVAKVIRVGIRMARLPWYAAGPLRTQIVSKFLAGKLIERL